MKIKVVVNANKLLKGIAFASLAMLTLTGCPPAPPTARPKPDPVPPLVTPIPTAVPTCAPVKVVEPSVSLAHSPRALAVLIDQTRSYDKFRQRAKAIALDYLRNALGPGDGLFVGLIGNGVPVVAMAPMRVMGPVRHDLPTPTPVAVSQVVIPFLPTPTMLPVSTGTRSDFGSGKEDVAATRWANQLAAVHQTNTIIAATYAPLERQLAENSKALADCQSASFAAKVQAENDRWMKDYDFQIRMILDSAKEALDTVPATPEGFADHKHVTAALYSSSKYFAEIRKSGDYRDFTVLIFSDMDPRHEDDPGELSIADLDLSRARVFAVVPAPPYPSNQPGNGQGSPGEYAKLEAWWKERLALAKSASIVFVQDSLTTARSLDQTIGRVP